MASLCSQIPLESPPCSNYFDNRTEPDHFPNLHLINIPDKDHEAKFHKAIENLLADAVLVGFPKAGYDDLRSTVMKHKHVFRLKCSSKPGGSIPSLKFN